MMIYVMKRIRFKVFLGILLSVGLGVGFFLSTGQVEAFQTTPTSYATVTYAEPVNVRGGPNTVDYPIIGQLAPGDIVPALGVTPGHEWVKISYPDSVDGVGWVYAIYVSISGPELPLVEIPPTATPRFTATIDATLEAAFNFQPTATRRPTFTPPPPLTVPQFTDSTPKRVGVPSGYFVASLLFLGALGLAVSFVLRK